MKQNKPNNKIDIPELHSKIASKNRVNRIFSTFELFQSLKLSLLNVILKNSFFFQQNYAKQNIQMKKNTQWLGRKNGKISTTNIQVTIAKQKPCLQSLYSFCLIWSGMTRACMFFSLLLLHPHMGEHFDGKCKIEEKEEYEKGKKTTTKAHIINNKFKWEFFVTIFCTCSITEWLQIASTVEPNTRTIRVCMCVLCVLGCKRHFCAHWTSIRHDFWCTKSVGYGFLNGDSSLSHIFIDTLFEHSCA